MTDGKEIFLQANFAKKYDFCYLFIIFIWQTSIAFSAFS